MHTLFLVTYIVISTAVWLEVIQGIMPSFDPFSKKRILFVILVGWYTFPLLVLAAAIIHTWLIFKKPDDEDSQDNQQQ